METKTIIGILLAVVVVGGGIYMFSSKHPASPSGAAAGDVAQNTAPTDTGGAGKFQGSLADLSTRGGEWKCTIDASTAQSISSGTVYVSGKNVRGDFSSNVASYGNVESHMIADGTNVYTWTSVLPQGFKMKMVAGGDGSGKTSGSGADVNQKYSYDCQPSSANASLFFVPTDIKFTAI